MKDKGSALLTSVIIVMILLIISGIFFKTVIYQAKNDSSEEKALKAYYMAESGIQYGIAAGIAAVLDGTLTDGGTLPLQKNNPFGQGGSFTVTLAREVGATSFTVKSTGDYLGIKRIKRAEYESVEEGSEGSEEGGGSDCGEYETWTNSKLYSKDAIICFNGKKFQARNATKNQQPGLMDSSWQELTELWRNFNIYKKKAIVLYNDSDKRPYEARNNTDKDQRPDSLDNNNPWQELTENWTKTNTYHDNDIVFYDNKPFQARNNTGKNEQPGLSSSPWNELTDEWKPYNSYNKNIVVSYNGLRYKAENKHSPNSTPPPNSSAWELTTSPLPTRVLLTISVTPIYASIQVGQTQVFTAKAVYSNGFEEISSTTANWSILNGGIATLSGHSVKGVSVGMSTVTASFGGKSGTATLKVSASTNPNPNPNPKGLLWEKEVVE